MQAIVSQAKATGRTRTAVIVEVLKEAFGLPAGETPPASLEGIHNQLDALSKKVACLNQQLVELASEALSSENKAQPLEESNQTLVVGQDLLEEISAGQPKISQSQKVGELLDTTDTSQVASQESKLVNGRCNELQENLQQLVEKVEQRARILDQVLSASIDHVCMYDRLGRYTYANCAFMQSLGFEGIELYGKTWQQLGLPPEMMKPFEAQRQIVFATGQSVAAEITLPTVNGSRDYEYILSPIYNADGSVEAVVYTARDITERKQVEESLRESEKNYRNLFEWAQDSIFITDHSTHRLLDVNEHGARRLGYTRKQLLSLPTEIISPPMDPTRRKAVLRKLWQTGSVIFEHVHISKDGTLRPVEVSSRVIEYDGQLAIQSFIRDITERKQTESALQESKHFIEKLTKITPSLIYIQDLTQKRYVYLNHKAQEFYGKTPEAMQKLGKGFLEKFLHPEDLAKLAPMAEKWNSAQDDQVIENEFRMKDATGQWRWFRSREAVYSRTPEGLPEQIIGTSIDITEFCSARGKV